MCGVFSYAAGAIERYCSDRQRLFEELSKQNDENLIYEVAHSSSVVLNARRHLEEELVIDHRLESLVERMVEESRKTGESGEVQALGVALESRRLDLVKFITTFYAVRELMLFVSLFLVAEHH